MNKIIINGGRRLEGNIQIQGAKNSVLPILAATILADGESVIKGCPRLSDVEYSVKILEGIGCRVKWEDDTIIVDSSVIERSSIPDDLMNKMRSSITFLGPLTARCHTARMCSPGGCELGPRPIDLHIKAFKEMGVCVREMGGKVETKAKKIGSAKLHLDFPSVGATENIMMAAVLADGKITVGNAAKEPEIIDLQNFLNKMGAKVRGAGTDVIEIEGVKRLHGAEHKIIPDRIVAATYMCAVAASGGEIELSGVQPEYLNALTCVLREAGADIKFYAEKAKISVNSGINSISNVKTQPYPGFPTDAQAVLTAALSVARGTSIVCENIFENRLRHCGELCRMGADITTKGNVAIIKGVPHLNGAEVCATELRGGAALVLAGVSAIGITTVEGTEYIDRGYNDIVFDFASLGADIKRNGGSLV